MKSWVKKKFGKKLYCVHDGSSWVLSEETKAISNVAKNLGCNIGGVGNVDILNGKSNAIYFNCQFQGVRYLHKKGKSRVAIAYFHGLPGSEPTFTEVFTHLCKQRDLVDRLHVSHSEMKNCLIDGGIESEKIYQIPIAVNMDLFQPRNQELSKQRRERMGIPEDAFVIGSFQKDGNGWGEGLEPKLIKGPDVFLKVIKNLKEKIPNLYVLLSGPSRGYVKNSLEEMGVHYQHTFYDDYFQVCRQYEALDCYLVASRQEGGPKSVLESMASRVPIVTTRVGQAMDLVKDQVNGFITESEDLDGLTDRVFSVYENKYASYLLDEAYQVASVNTYEAQTPLWEDFFSDFCN